ncbi:hypothetical protein CCAL9344_02395 [Campylobacter sp. RM9344]|uniref:DUF7494 domain-containing protein n=1 Tax=Campylobacter californiensis TaxID=1032243 RepID=A0AAW3ZWU4_9BACT|nr:MULTISPECIES: hypothetical protein [unclassified Campylobacter]MBE2984585.1 hypothetical protein [Campylobacter sp. RM6883]MBE2995127.1 hypothetical protein [Campylobacter sp. RM6913]MBE3029048.1 hypothetical protein [Campylobacter sp. RM9344]MBE3607405.1 hypothetical protein [Campylobacter sp. RM9337]QCD50058.1 paralysed flagella protein A [Campylobacter sp. RM6914]
MKKAFLVLFFPIFIYAFNLSLNSGIENGKPYSVLQLSDEEEFECVEQLLAYDTKRYVCMLNDGVLPQIEDTILPLMDIKYKKQDGKLFVIILPKANSRLLNISSELYNDTRAFSSSSSISKHFSIIIDQSLKEFDPLKPNGLNFAPDFSELLRPSIGALDLNMAPIEGMDSNDIDLYINIKRAYESGNYPVVVAETKIAIQRHPQSLFASEFLLYRLRALDKIFEKEDRFEDSTPNSLVAEGRAWMRKFAADENYPEVLYIIARAYLKDGIASDAKYMLDTLINEHERSKFTRLTMLDYADYLYKNSRQKEAISFYENVLYNTGDVNIASRAALSLVDANIDKEKFENAKNFILKILNANEKFFMNDPARAINLAGVFVDKNMPDVAAKIYEIIVDNSERNSPFYEVALKNIGINLAKLNDVNRAYAYLKRYESEFKYNGEYSAEVTQALDALFFELKENNSTKLHEHYRSLMDKYDSSDIGKKALVSEMALNFNERKYRDVLSYTQKARDLNLTEATNYLDRAAYELARIGFINNDCQIVINLLENYDVDKISLPQFKLYECYFRTARYNDALNLSKSHIKDENLEDRVEWLVNLSKILYQMKDYEQTVQVANEALGLGAGVEYSDPTPVLFDRFYSLLNLNRIEEAIATLSAIEQLRGQDFKIIEAYNAISEYAFGKNNHATVTVYAKKALELQTRVKINVFSPKLNLLYATSLLKIDSINEALDEAKYILNMKLEPQDRLRALNLISEIYIKLKRYDLAREHLNECVGSNFNSPWKSSCEAQLQILN